MDIENSLRDTFQSIGRLHEYANKACFMDEIKTFLHSKLLPDTIILLSYTEAKTPDILYQWIPNFQVGDMFAKFYIPDAYLLDPFYSKTLEDYSAKAYSLDEIAPDEFLLSEYYKQYFKKTGMVDEIGCFISISSTSTVQLSLGRNQGRDKFSTAETALFDTLTPMLIPFIKTFVTQHLPPVVEDKLANKKVLLADYIYQNNKFRLTEREAQITAYVLKGHSSLSISLILELSVGTIKVHRRNIYRKMNISSQAQLFSHFSTFS